MSDFEVGQAIENILVQHLILEVTDFFENIFCVVMKQIVFCVTLRNNFLNFVLLDTQRTIVIQNQNAALYLL